MNHAGTMRVFLKQVSVLCKCLGFRGENIWHTNSSFHRQVKNLRCFMADTSNFEYDSSKNAEPFLPKKALVLTKFSRYEFEKRRHADLSEEELIKNVSHITLFITNL